MKIEIGKMFTNVLLSDRGMLITKSSTSLFCGWMFSPYAPPGFCSLVWILFYKDKGRNHARSIHLWQTANKVIEGHCVASTEVMSLENCIFFVS